MQSIPDEVSKPGVATASTLPHQSMDDYAWLTPTRILKLLGIGFFYAVLVWVFIRFRGPAGAFSGWQQILN